MNIRRIMRIRRALSHRLPAHGLGPAESRVYDRITGKKLGTKFFPAPKDCMDSFTARAGTTIAPDSHSWADKEGVAKWAATFAR